jgi:SAM-dependent methyltransferase
MALRDFASSASASITLSELAIVSKGGVMTFGHGVLEMATAHSNNLVFQGKKHPLMCGNPRSLEEHCLKLIHLKAYEVAAEIAAGKQVLDLGCNNGYGTRVLAGRAHRVTGVDVSAAAIAAAEKDDAPPNVEFRLVDGLSLPFESGAFDCLVSFQVIEHIVDVDAYLREVVRVLAPHGTAVFTTPNRHIRLDPGMKPWNRFHIVEFGSDDLADALGKHFMDVEVRGLFAIPAIYDIEYARVQRSRHAARSLVHRSIAQVANSVIPASALRTLRDARTAIMAGPRVASGDPTATAELSTANLYYRTNNLNLSLDLMAVCRMGCANG